MISTQEIKEVIKGITHEPNEKYIEKIKIFFEYDDNNELISVSGLRRRLISILYNYEELHQMITKNKTSSLLSIHNVANRVQKERDNLQREKNNLERERNEWRTKFNNKNREYEDYKEKYEKVNEELYKEKLNHANKMSEEKLKNKDDKSTSNEKISRLEEKLEASNSEKIDLRKRLKDKEDENNRLLIKLDDKNNQLTVLRIESGKKDDEIINLKNQTKSSVKRAEKSQEELLNEKINSKKRSLELFATELKVDLGKVHNLSRYHERLFQARKSFNRANIETHENNITKTKEELQNAGISIVSIQELCEKCENIAELRWELEQQQQQQFQTQQEVPINNNF